MVSWKDTWVVFHCLSRVPGCIEGSRLSPMHITLRIRLFLMRRARWIFNKCGVILTLIIHWLGPPLSLPRNSKATLAIWGERLAKGPYQESFPISTLGFLPVDLSWTLDKDSKLFDLLRSLIQKFLFYMSNFNSMSVLPVARVQFPVMVKYFKGFSLADHTLPTHLKPVWQKTA